MQPCTLNHLPIEIIHLIAQKLDFESHRDFRLTSKAIYESTDIERSYHELAQDLCHLGKLYEPPTSQQLNEYKVKSAFVCAATVSTCSSMGGVALMLGGVSNSALWLPGMIIAVGFSATLPVLAAGWSCFYDEPFSDPAIPQKTKLENADMERLLGDKSSHGNKERRQYHLEVDAAEELSSFDKRKI